jgi:hypothetical protein
MGAHFKEVDPCCIHHPIRLPNQFVNCFRHLKIGKKSNAERDRPVILTHPLPQGLLQPTSNDPRGLRASFRQQNHELIISHAGNDITPRTEALIVSATAESTLSPTP